MRNWRREEYVIPAHATIETVAENSRECKHLKRDNVRDHRAGTSDHPFQKHAQVRLRVHHIVIPRSRLVFGGLVVFYAIKFITKRKRGTRPKFCNAVDVVDGGIGVMSPK